MLYQNKNGNQYVVDYGVKKEGLNPDRIKGERKPGEGGANGGNDSPKLDGTYFFGGAGMDGDYIPDMVSAFEDAGISDVHSVNREKWSGGTLLDAGLGVMALHDEMPDFPLTLDGAGDGKGQLNLVGYSFGSLAAAQVAIKHARQGGVVDNLVLIGAPISQKFLETLRGTGNIRNVIVKDLYMQKDPIYAGMTRREIASLSPVLGIQMMNQNGHFYYAPPTTEGSARRRELAKELYKDGLR